jgi:hypothetical protein
MEEKTSPLIMTVAPPSGGGDASTIVAKFKANALFGKGETKNCRLADD